MAPEPGHAVGPYDIVAVLGRGGMGAVYLARDRRLGRQVALKFLHAEADAGAGEWRRRLLREARAASALNHPNICHIYDVGGEGAESWIAMEYVDGPPLRATIGADGLPVEAVLRVAAQLADALAHAHAHGILHRDLKSANVARDTSGRVRILDFGIAARLPETVAQEATHTATSIASPEIQGTLAYLAPEILRGKPATAQSDLWSFGVLLHEMLTGAVPFQGRNTFELASAILENPPPPLPPRVPPPVARIVAKLLAKDPADRYRSAAEVSADLDSTGEPGRPRAGRPGVALAVVGLFALLAILAYGAWRVRQVSPLEVSEQRLLSTLGGSQRAPAYAPDGRKLAYVASDDEGVQQIWIRSVSDPAAIQVTSGPVPAGRPRWFAGGDRIVYARGGEGIWSVSSQGGTPTRIVDRGVNPDVSRDGTRLVFESNRSLWTARLDGSGLREVAGQPPVYYSVPLAPALSPDGTQIAFFRPEVGPNGDLWVIPTAGGDARRLTFDLREGGWPAWTPDGRAIVFSSARAGSRTLWQIPSDGGEPVAVTSGAGEDDQPAISADGRHLAYTNVRNAWELRIRDLSSGLERSLLRRGLELLFPMFSPDGTRIAFFGRSDTAVAIFTIGADGSDLRQLTAGRELNHQPRWGSTGEHVYFFQVAPEPSFRRVPALGGASVAFRDWKWETHNAPLFDPVGRFIAYLRQSAPGAPDGDPPRTVLHEIATGREQVWPVPHTRITGWSADGSAVVGTRDGSIVICGVPSGACRALTSGTQPVWPAQGNRIFFRRTAAGSGTQQLWAIAPDGSGEEFVAELGAFRPIDRFFDVSRHGLAAWAPFEPGQHQLWAARLQ